MVSRKQGYRPAGKTRGSPPVVPDIVSKPQPSASDARDTISETHRSFLVERIHTLEERVDSLEGRRPPSVLPLWGIIGVLILAQVYTLRLSSELEPVADSQAAVNAPPEADPTPEPDPDPEPEVDVDDEATAVPSGQPRQTSVWTNPTRITAPPETIPEDEPPQPQGVVVVQGAGDVYMLDAQGLRLSPGTVDVGRYTLYGTLDGRPDTLLITVQVAENQNVRVQCGFGTCKIRQ